MSYATIPAIEQVFETGADVVTATPTEIMTRADEWITVVEPPRRPISTVFIETVEETATKKIVVKGFFLHAIRAGFSAVLWTFIGELAETGLKALTEVSTETKQKNRTKRTHFCVSHILGILANARKDLDFMENRALETDNTKRTKRKFKGRK